MLSVFHWKSSEPHFPQHQISSDGSLATPAQSHIAISPSPALDAEVPLSTASLLELSQWRAEETLKISSTSPTEESTPITTALPAAPTSTLPLLRAEEARPLELSLLHASKTPEKHWGCHEYIENVEEAAEQEKEAMYLANKLGQELLGSAPLAITPQEMNSQFKKLEDILPEVSTSSIHTYRINMILKNIAEKNDLPHDNKYRFKERARILLTAHDRMAGVQHRREAVQGDVLVVSVVLLFVFAIIMVEMADIALFSLKIFFGIESQGAIRLPDEDDEIRKPFALMPAPKGRKLQKEKPAEVV